MMDARKMPIYTPQSVDGFELCHPVHHDDFGAHKYQRGRNATKELMATT
jgi:hypothetical protein